ncbi:MAG TPA: hypothetical protein VHL77_09230 [Ferruginibacter sp.]|nr:hypothetical protein [Ferruginibacter sp.]
MRTTLFSLSFLFITAFTLISCQKEVDGTIVDGGGVVPANQFPKVGTIWTYRYEWYNVPGGATNNKVIHHKATKDTTLGGETYLKIIDVEADTTVYYLRTKTDGLYQYTNNNAYLLCKYPASVGDSYSSFNGGSAESFAVLGMDETTPTGIGDIKLSKYEGVKSAYVIDIFWYNKNAWITWKFQYNLLYVSPSYVYFLKSRLYIDNIVY